MLKVYAVISFFTVINLSESHSTLGLENIDAVKDEIVRSIPHFYKYGGRMIQRRVFFEENNDMYDFGLEMEFAIFKTNTSSSYPIQYDDHYDEEDYQVQVISSLCWPLTVLMYVNNSDNSVSGVQYTSISDPGADGYGVLNNYTSNMTSTCGVGISYHVIQIYGADDPTICEVYFTTDNTTMGPELFATENHDGTEFLDSAIALMNYPTNTWLGFMLLSRKFGMKIEDSEIQNSLGAAVDAMLGCERNPIPPSPNKVEAALERIKKVIEKVANSLSDFFKYFYFPAVNEINRVFRLFRRGGNKVYFWTDTELKTHLTYEEYYDREEYEVSSSKCWPFLALMYIRNEHGTRENFNLQVIGHPSGTRDVNVSSGTITVCGTNVTYVATQAFSTDCPCSTRATVGEVYFALKNEIGGASLEQSMTVENRSGYFEDTLKLNNVATLEDHPSNAWLGYFLLSRFPGYAFSDTEIEESLYEIVNALLDNCQDPCEGHRCLDQGSCVPTFMHDDFTCSACPEGRIGRQCRIPAC